MNKAIDNSDMTKVKIYTEDFVLIGYTYLKSYFSQYEKDGKVKLSIKSFYHPVLYLNLSDNVLEENNISLFEGPVNFYIADTRFFAPKKIKAIVSRFNEPGKILLEHYEMLELTEEDLRKIDDKKSSSLNNK